MWNTSAAESWLYVGSTVGGSDIADSGNLGNDTSYLVNDLPTDGSTVHVRLWYRQTAGVGTWNFIDSQYNAFTVNTEITSPPPSSTLAGQQQNFVWTTPAEESWIYVGSTVGGNDIADSGNLGNATSFTVGNLPVLSLIHI